MILKRHILVYMMLAYMIMYARDFKKVYIGVHDVSLYDHVHT